MLTDRGVKILYQKKKKKVLKLHEMSRKVVSIARKTGQTDRRHYDDNVIIVLKFAQGLWPHKRQSIILGGHSFINNQERIEFCTGPPATQNIFFLLKGTSINNYV